MEGDVFSIQELADTFSPNRSGVLTPRTIRYYIAEGLLPKPDGRGRFTNVHQNRLLLIQRFKDAYLPLAEIRARVAPLTDAEVLVAVESPNAPEDVRALAEPEEDAAAYIMRLRRGGAMSRTPAVPSAAVTREAAPTLKTAPRSKEGTESQSWQRFTLAPGLELHVRRTPVPEPFVRVLADRIRAFAATLPGEGEPGVSERNPPESL